MWSSKQAWTDERWSGLIAWADRSRNVTRLVIDPGVSFAPISPDDDERRCREFLVVAVLRYLNEIADTSGVVRHSQRRIAAEMRIDARTVRAVFRILRDRELILGGKLIQRQYRHYTLNRELFDPRQPARTPQVTGAPALSSTVVLPDAESGGRR